MRVGGRWNYVCLLVDLSNREIVGHSCGPRKDAKLVMRAFSTVAFPLTDIEVFHTDRGSEFDNMSIDAMLAAFGIERSLTTGDAAKAAVVEFIESYYNRRRPHSSIGYRIPAEAMEAFFERTDPEGEAAAMAA